MIRTIAVAVAVTIAAGAGFGVSAAYGSPSPASARSAVPEVIAEELPAIGDALYGETVYAADDGAVRAAVWQHGEVTTTSDSALTVRSTDGTEWTWTVNGDTAVYLEDATGSMSDIAAGDTVRVSGERDGDTRTASTVADPPPDFGAIRERLGDLDLPKLPRRPR